MGGLMGYYRDLREFIATLEEAGELKRIKRQVIKETELLPLHRLQFRGLPEEKRKVLLFENVVNVKGQKYFGTVAAGVYGVSKQVYALGLKARLEDLRDKWLRALQSPIEAEIVSCRPVHEEIHIGKELEELGLDEISPPVEEPGFSGSIRTGTHWVTKDPETGIRNVGTYSGHFSSRTFLRGGGGPTSHADTHWKKCKAMGTPLDAAIIVGVTPNVADAASGNAPYGVDEYAVAGGLVGESVPLVRCKTVDLEVPATAEIVIEGRVLHDTLEPHTSFGEYPGYMYQGTGDARRLMQVTCITHRKNPIFTPFLVGLAPTDSRGVTNVPAEAVFFKFLKYDCNIPGVLDVAFPEPMTADNYCVIQIKKTHPSQPWHLLYAVVGYGASKPKVAVVVDEDIDPRDMGAVLWAISFSVQPHRDVKIVTGRSAGLDPSASPPGAGREERKYPGLGGASAMLIDATRKWPYPPVGLPKKEYMERALEIWKEEGLGELNLRAPWYGYNLGNWDKEDEENAELILQGEYKKIGEKLAKRRVKI
jgi:4-hydroxy-3-polyprenylbenzoate decarboxylase